MDYQEKGHKLFNFDRRLNCESLLKNIMYIN